jgi:hypothetical protein
MWLRVVVQRLRKDWQFREQPFETWRSPMAPTGFDREGLITASTPIGLRQL